MGLTCLIFPDKVRYFEHEVLVSWPGSFSNDGYVLLQLKYGSGFTLR